jgi:HSP20 family protein
VGSSKFKNESPTINMKKEKSMKSELVKSEPFGELEKEVRNFRNRLSSLFKHGNGGDSWFREEDAKLAEWSPAVDVSEDDDEYLIKADLPEVEKDQVKVTVAEGQISIKGERKHEEEEKKKKFHRIERSYGQYLRTFSIPADADASEIKAEFENGVLKVHLPKSEEKKLMEEEIEIH